MIQFPANLSRLQRDGLITAVFIVSLFMLFHFIEAFEAVYEITRDHEDWEADEFVMLFLAVPLPLAWFAWRRVREIHTVAQQKIALEQSLTHTRKLESLGTLAGGIAHEINNQLTPVLSMSEMLLTNLHENDPMRRKLDLIQRGASRARETVLRIKEFSRSGEGSGEDCNVASTLEYTRELVSHFTPSSIQVEFSLQNLYGESAISCIDLEAVIINLFSNAIDAIGSGKSGRIRVFAETRTLLSGPTKLLPAGAYACIIISDSGPGIDDETRKHIFDPFFTTKPVGKGMGLGLSIIHAIIQRAGGEIKVESGTDTGARFTVFLPLREKQASHDPQTAIESEH